MSEMKTVRTAELIGEALDWAVAKALGWQMVRVPSDIDGANDSEVIAPPDFSKDFKFPPRGAIPAQYFLRRWSTDWSQGGALLDQHCKGFGLIQDGKATTWRAFGYSRHVFDSERLQRLQRMASGPSILVAACRAIVAANLGDEVQIPAELLP